MAFLAVASLRHYRVRGGPFTIFAIFLWHDHILAVASPERGALSPPLSWSIRDTKTGGGGGGARRGEGEGAKGGGQLLKRSIKRFHILGICSDLIYMYKQHFHHRHHQYGCDMHV